MTATLEWCDRAAAVAARSGRADMAERIRTVAARVRRSDAVVCVVGEFKQGKSSLANALVDSEVCPVDDDLATAVVTVLHHADTPTAVVHRREAGERRSEPVELADAARLVREPRRADVERVDIGVPHPLLAEGLMLIDMPGSGGIGGGATAAALSFVALADAVLFLTDASAELSAPEVDLLRRVRERCPNVVVCVTKTDLHPHWRKVAALDRAHLAAAEVDAPVVPVSSTLFGASAGRGDELLARASGIPGLTRLLREEIVPAARAGAERQALAVAVAAVEQLAAIRRAELAACRPDADQGSLDDALARARAAVERLRGPGSRWPTVLNERMGQIASEVGHDLRAAVRTMTKALDEQIDAADSAEQWDEIARSLQNQVSDTVHGAFQAITGRTDDVRNDLAELLGLPELTASVLEPGRPAVPDADLPAGVAARRNPASAGLQVFDALRGASGGVIILGLLSSTLPAAVGAVLVTNPFTIGLGLFAGGRTLLEGRARRLTQRRQQVRVALRQYLDDVQFTVGNEFGSIVREMHVGLRDQVIAAVEQLQQNLTDLTVASDRGRANEADRAARASVLEQDLAELDALLAGRPA